MNKTPLYFGINGVDVIMAIAIGLIVYVKRDDGIVTELFKTFGVLCTVFITLHFYARFAVFLQDQFFGKEVNPELFTFLLLAILFSVAFAFISSGWTLILKIKSFDWLDHWGNIALSLIRGYFICSLIYLAIALTGQNGFAAKAKDSATGPFFAKGAPSIYHMAYSGIIRKMFRDEMINEKAFRLIGEQSGYSDI